MGRSSGRPFFCLFALAIIGVLVAISIPIFTAQLEKIGMLIATLANLRAAYAEASAAYLTGTDSANANVTMNANDEGGTVVVSNVNILSTDANYGTEASNLPFHVTPITKKSNAEATFVFQTNREGLEGYCFCW